MQQFKLYQKKWVTGVLILLVFGISQVLAKEPTTNSIPQNLFLTDNGFLFWQRKSGEEVVNIKEIQRAQNSLESRPAGQDPEGHWGPPTNGFQISLRFKKNTFTNSEPIVAVTLVRNITSQPRNYFRPIQIVVTKDGKRLAKKSQNDIKVTEIHNFPETEVLPQTQRRDIQDLRQIYEFPENGEYSVQAMSSQPEAASQRVDIMVTNNIRNK